MLNSNLFEKFPNCQNQIVSCLQVDQLRAKDLSNEFACFFSKPVVAKGICIAGQKHITSPHKLAHDLRNSLQSDFLRILGNFKRSKCIEDGTANSICRHVTWSASYCHASLV